MNKQGLYNLKVQACKIKLIIKLIILIITIIVIIIIIIKHINGILNKI